MLGTAHGERVAVDRDAFRSAFHLVRRVDRAKPAFRSDDLLPARERRPLHPVAELRGSEDAVEIRAGIRHEEVIGRVERQRMRIPKARVGDDRRRSGAEPEPVTRGTAVPTLENAHGMIAVIGNRQPLTRRGKRQAIGLGETLPELEAGMEWLSALLTSQFARPTAKP